MAMAGLLYWWRVSQTENVSGAGLNAIRWTDSVSPFASSDGFAKRVILIDSVSFNIIARQV